MSLGKFLPWLWAVVVAAVVGHNAYLWWGQRLAADTDILALLPEEQRDPALQRAFTHMVNATQQRLTVLIGAADWADALRAADAYSGVLAEHSQLIQSAGRMTDQTGSDWVASFEERRLTLMTPQDEANLRSQPEEFWTDVALAKLYSPFTGLGLTAWQDDPFGLFGNWIQARSQESPVRPRAGRLIVSGGERDYVVLPLTLHVPAFSMAGQHAVMALLEQARQAAYRVAPNVELIQTGLILHAAAASAQAQRETLIIGIGSLAGIVLLVWVTFRSIKPLVLIMITIVIGFLGALSISWLMFDRLHMITLVFGATLIGVAQDYGIYFLCKRCGANDALDSWQLLRHILPALVIALVTTLIGYMGLVLTPFPGLHQMAAFSVLGLLFAWLTVVFWFPALVRADTRGNQRLLDWCARRLTRWPLFRYNRRALFILMATVLAVSALIAWPGLGVQDDIRSLQNPPKALIADQLKLNELLDLPSPAQFYLLRGATAEEVLQREEMLKQRLDRLIEDRRVSGYHAISNWAPSARLNASRRRLIEQALLDENGALANLAKKLGEDRAWVAAMRARLLESSAAIVPEEFLKTPAGEPWRFLWLGKVGDGFASIVALRGVNKESLPALARAGAALPGVQFVDKVGEISAVLAAYRGHMSWVLLLSYLAVYGLLYPRYRRGSWRVLAPAAFASVIALALLAVSGQGLQLFHVLGLMLLLGIGVDYGIYFQETNNHRDGAASLAVGLSALSTLLSFGLLGVSRTPALQAFGLTMAIGIAAAALIVPYFRSRQCDERLSGI